MLQELMDYGLSEKEANIYLISLKTGEATANRIAELANYPRSTTYDILERLKHLGLISTIIVDNKTHFIASSPKTLLVLLNEKKESISNLVPKLNKIYNQVGEKPQTEVFQGKKALIKIFDEILNNAKELLVMGSQGNALEKIDYHPKKFRLKRIENKVQIKQILEDSKEARNVPVDKFTKVKFLKSFDRSKEATFIFDDYVYHIILQYEISAIKIKSKDHSEAMRIMFKELWQKSIS
jgi:sugar-specific transcriptional regulator TrmB